MNDKSIAIQEIKDKIKKFVKDRDWEQFHSPKNLAMSIAIEAGELMEHFQWLTIEESHKHLKDKKALKEIEEELADIAMYVFEFCNIFKIELGPAMIRKLNKNARKYPSRLVRGKAHKYTHYKKGTE